MHEQISIFIFFITIKNDLFVRLRILVLAVAKLTVANCILDNDRVTFKYLVTTDTISLDTC